MHSWEKWVQNRHFTHSSANVSPTGQNAALKASDYWTLTYDPTLILIVVVYHWLQARHGTNNIFILWIDMQEKQYCSPFSRQDSEVQSSVTCQSVKAKIWSPVCWYWKLHVFSATFWWSLFLSGQCRDLPSYLIIASTGEYTSAIFPTKPWAHCLTSSYVTWKHFLIQTAPFDKKFPSAV